MFDILRSFALTFVPLFVAVDAIGVLPFLLPLTQDLAAPQRTRVIRLAMITALALGLGFVAVGKGVLFLLNIEIADFLVAGGLILLLLAAKDIITGRMWESNGFSVAEAGAVPIGTPLVTGPAVLTTLLILTGQYNIVIVIVSFILNLLLTWLIFSQANRIVAFLGQGGVRATSKIAALFLAAIAIKMIRQGVLQILG
jgi:multiple antibiotic resistance protein